jgi:hypothetical protein
VRRLHYSGRTVPNSQFHIGVFWQGALEGAIQFGPPLDKRRLIRIVEGTGWNEMIELNRMAFSGALPRNSESRALSVACRLLRAHAPHVKWFVTFADAAQCGDGTIYRAAGFLLTQIHANKSILEAAGERFTDVGYRTGTALRTRVNKAIGIEETGTGGLARLKASGGKVLPGFQIRYVKFLDPAWRTRLVVPVLPYSEIGERGASMIRGRSVTAHGQAHPLTGDGSTPIRPLHLSETDE